MNENVKKKLTYIVLLVIGVACQLIPRVFHVSWGAGIAAFFWMYAFLELIGRFRSKRALLLTGFFFVLGYCLFFAGALGKTGISWLLFIVFGLMIYAILCGTAHVMNKWNRFWVTLFLPVLWTVEYMLATLLRFPSLVRIDMMFTDLTVLIQAERLIGPVGFSFLILWIVALLRYASANRKLGYVVLCACMLLAMLLPGIISMYPNTEAAETVRVAYAMGPYIGDFMNYSAASYEENEASLERSIGKAAYRGASILVFNEEAFEMEDTHEERFLTRCAELARENSIAVLLGLDISDTDGSRHGKSENKLILFDDKGNVQGSYLKSRLLPFIESDYVSGDGSIPANTLELDGKSVKISYLICYDSNFPAYVRKVDADTDILFLPSWDWSAVTGLHSKLCRAIAVENHFSILKPTYDGLSIAVDPDGRVIHASSTDETGYERVHIVEMPIKSTIREVETKRETSPYTYAIIGAEMLGIFVCLILLLGNIIGNREKTKRYRWFIALVASSMIGCVADALSWILDGCARLNPVLYVSSGIAIVMTFALVGIFISYLTEYIKERRTVSSVPCIVSWVYVGVAVVLTVAACFSGKIFTIENGVYSDGVLYPLYVVANAGALIIGVVIIFLYRKALDLHDRLIAYTYMAIPIISAGINLFIEEWAFTYAAITLSLLVINVMIQSDKVEKLASEGVIVSYHATHDELTGLSNSRAFHDRIEVLKDRDGESGVIFGDLNGLKYTNDNFGHEAGDRLLIRYAEILMEIFRMNEIYRISGDEFICMMENVPEEVFMHRLSELKKRLAEDEQPLACIGAQFGRNREVEALLKSAETNMYAEKEIVHARFPNLKR